MLSNIGRPIYAVQSMWRNLCNVEYAVRSLGGAVDVAQSKWCSTCRATQVVQPMWCNICAAFYWCSP
eukprot:5486523-Pyramimonas_sp.AAC.1